MSGRDSKVASRGIALGFTLVELMITLAVLAILVVLAVSSFTDWVRNTQVRSVADAMQNGLRLAQTEALRRNRTVVFSLTAGIPRLNSAATANSANWAIQTLPILGIDGLAEFVQGGAFGDVAAGVTIQGPPAICFNSAGRLVPAAADQTGVGAACTPAAVGATSVPYTISRAAGQLRAGSDRPLQINVSLAGQVRMCDPAKELSGASPDGCPR